MFLSAVVLYVDHFEALSEAGVSVLDSDAKQGMGISVTEKVLRAGHCRRCLQE